LAAVSAGLASASGVGSGSSTGGGVASRRTRRASSRESSSSTMGSYTYSTYAMLAMARTRKAEKQAL
jgi:hypothetical protein